MLCIGWVKSVISTSLFFTPYIYTTGRGAYATGTATNTNAGTVSGTTGGGGLARLDSDPHNLRSAGEFMLLLMLSICFMCTNGLCLFEPLAMRSLIYVAF